MGKLGGEELNFSSDVDVCYFYSSDAGQAGARSLHEYYSELSRRITAAIEEVTDEGMIFRVDLRLRPEGRSGPLCNSLAAAERYYETFGRTWERQALLRARPCAATAFGARLLAMVEPFVYPRSIDPRMVSEIRRPARMFRPRGSADGHRRSTSSWAPAASATSSWSHRRCSCCTGASGATCVSAPPRAGCTGCGSPDCSAIAR